MVRKFQRLATAVIVCAGAGLAPAHGQGIPRVKAKITAFDGQTMTLMGGSGTDIISVKLQPSAQIVRVEKRTPGDIKINDYIGATIIKGSAGTYVAQEVHIFPQALRGVSEGLFALTKGSSINMADGTVDAVGQGGLSLKFHGDTGSDGGGCTGRKPATGGCQGDVTMAFIRNMPVTALVSAGKADLVPGAIIAVSVMTGPDGNLVTPGLTIESSPPASAPPSADSAAGTPSLRSATRAVGH